MHAVRILLVLLLLAFTGMLMGAASGAIAGMIVAVALFGFGEIDLFLALIGAVFGAPLGMILAPFAGFTVLRHVPLWRLFAELTVGTVLGGVAVAMLRLDPFLPLLGGVVGFTVAAYRLYRQAPDEKHHDVLAPAPSQGRIPSATRR